MERGSRIREFLEDLDDARNPGLALPRQTHFPARMSSPQMTFSSPIGSQIPRTASTAPSTTSPSDDDSLSGASSISSASSVDSFNQNPVPPWEQQGPNQVFPFYDLPCEFEHAGCTIQFPREQFEEWISHSASHFIGAGPPPKTICLFCDARSGFFEDSSDPISNWRARMIHIGRHYYNGAVDSQRRPDYWGLEHMRTNNIIDAEHYEQVTKFTERPHCNGLVLDGQRPPEMKRNDKRKSWQAHNLEREARQIRKEQKDREKGGMGKGKETEKEKGAHHSRGSQNKHSR